MKCTVAILLLFTFCLTGKTQSALSQRVELKRLELENKYQSVGYFDTLTCIATVYDDGKMSYIDTSGRLLLPFGSETRNFSDGFGIYYDARDSAFRVIDKAGNSIRKFKNILSLQGFKKGRAIFSAPAGEAVRYGVIDFDGNIVIDNRYPYIERISDKYYYVNNNKNGAGIINTAGDTIIPLEYNILYVDTSDLHFIGHKKGVGYAIFSSSGQVIKYWGKEVNPESSIIEGAHYFQRDSVIIIKNQRSSLYGETALLSLSLDTIIPMGRYKLSTINEGMVRYCDTVEIEKIDERVTSIQLNRCGFLNTRGDVVIPAQFDYAQYFTEGLSAVRQNDQWGYIDKQGRVVIPFRFDYALPFRAGYAKVKINDSFFIIDRSGNIVLRSGPY